MLVVMAITLKCRHSKNNLARSQYTQIDGIGIFEILRSDRN